MRIEFNLLVALDYEGPVSQSVIHNEIEKIKSAIANCEAVSHVGDMADMVYSDSPKPASIPA